MSQNQNEPKPELDPTTLGEEGVSSDALFSLIIELSKRLIWIAPVGNYVGGAYSREKGHFKQEIRGYMVCRRFVNNVDQPNTAITFLRNDGKDWKKPFTEDRGMFPSMEMAIIAAAKHEGIWENATVQTTRPEETA